MKNFTDAKIVSNKPYNNDDDIVQLVLSIMVYNNTNVPSHTGILPMRVWDIPYAYGLPVRVWAAYTGIVGNPCFARMRISACKCMGISAHSG